MHEIKAGARRRIGKAVCLGVLALAILLLASAKAVFLNDAALFLLLPLCGCFALIARDPSPDAFALLRRTDRKTALPALLLTVLFFLQLPVFDLLSAPLFSEAGLKTVIWHYRITRLAFLAWNWLVLLPAAAFSAYVCLSAALTLFTSPRGEKRLLGRDRKTKIFGATSATLVIAAVSVACLLSALPSMNDPDTATIWYGSVKMIWSDWHPVTYRFLVKLCSLICYSRLTVTSLQAIAFLFVSAAAVKLLDELDARAGKVYAAVLVAVFVPCFLLQKMTKDIPFATALLGLAVSELNILNAEKRRFKDWLAFGLCGYFVISFRHAGALPLIGAALPLAVYGLKHDRKIARNALISAGSAALLYVLVVEVLAFGVLNAVRNPSYIKYGTPMSMIASVVAAGETLEPEDQALLEEVMPLEKWADCYVKYFPGTLSREYSLIGGDINKVVEKNLGPRLTLLSVKLMFTHPKQAMATLFDNAAIVWKIACPADCTPDAPINYALTVNETDPMDTEYTGLTEFTHRYAEFLYNVPVLRSVCYFGGFSVFALVFSAVVLLKKRRCRELLAAIPILLLTAGLMISVPAPNTRYALPAMELAILFTVYALFVPARAEKQN